MLSSRQRAVSTVVSLATRTEAAGFHRMTILPSSSTAAPVKTDVAGKNFANLLLCDIKNRRCYLISGLGSFNATLSRSVFILLHQFDFFELWS